MARLDVTGGFRAGGSKFIRFNRSFVSCTLLMVCGMTIPASSVDAHPVPPAAKPRVARTTDDTAPSALRAAYVSARQTNADRHYAIDATDTALRAESPAMKAPVGFGSGGLHVGGAEGSLDLRLTTFGCEGAAETVSAVRPAIAKNRATFSHPLASGASVDEWYVNGPLGVEQGFTLNGGIACAARRDLVISMGVEGNVTPSLAGDGSIDFRRPSGEVAYHYADLHTFDANGRELQSHMDVAEGAVRLIVDARDAAYPLVVDPLIWTEQQAIDAGPGVARGSTVQVSVDGDTAVIAAELPDYYGGGDPEMGFAGEGAAYVFARSGSTWTLRQKLTPEAGSNDFFYGQVSLQGDTLVVGGDAYAPFPARGIPLAYVFTRHDGQWSLQQKIPTDSQEITATPVDLSGDTLVVGPLFEKPAKVYVRSGSTWTLQQELPDGDAESGVAMSSVSIDGDTIVASSYYTQKVRVFVRSSSTWTLQQELSEIADRLSGNFGSSVIVRGDTVLVGDMGQTSPQGVLGGGVFVFVRNGTTWTPQQKLFADDGEDFAGFGTSVSLSGDTAVVGGVHWYDEGTGSAYVFSRSGTRWTQQQRLVGSDPDPGPFYGQSVSISGTTAFVATALWDSLETPKHSQGRAHVFTAPAPATATATSPAKDDTDLAVVGCGCSTAGGPGERAHYGAWLTLTLALAVARRRHRARSV